MDPFYKRVNVSLDADLRSMSDDDLLREIQKLGSELGLQITSGCPETA